MPFTFSETTRMSATTLATTGDATGSLPTEAATGLGIPGGPQASVRVVWSDRQGNGSLWLARRAKQETQDDAKGDQNDPSAQT